MTNSLHFFKDFQSPRFGGSPNNSTPFQSLRRHSPVFNKVLKKNPSAIFYASDNCNSRQCNHIILPSPPSLTSQWGVSITSHHTTNNVFHVSSFSGQQTSQSAPSIVFIYFLKMLQWMGGSRRKVTTSKRSTINRQRHFFEQRKREVKRPHATFYESSADGIPACDHSQKPHWSLDIQCLQNLSTVAQELDCHITKFPPDILDKAAPASSDDFAEPKTSMEFQVEPVSPPKVMLHACHDQNNASTTHNVKSEHLKMAKQYPSVFDLLADDGPDEVFRANPPYESHVAFSVEGLGKVASKTPDDSPPQHYRSCALPPDPPRRSYGSTNHNFSQDFIDLGVTTKIKDDNLSMGCSSLNLPFYSNFNMDSIIYPDFDDCLQLGVTGGKVMNKSSDFFSSDEESDNICNAKSGFLDKNFHYEPEYDKTWKSRPCLMDDGSSGLFECDDQVMSDFFRRSPCHLKRRETEEAREDSFNIIELDTPYYGHGRSKTNPNLFESDVPRHSGVEKWGHFQNKNNHHALSCFMVENSEDNLSLPSEESCSSSAVIGDSSRTTNKRQSIGKHINYLKRPVRKYIDNLSSKEAAYGNPNLNPKEENLKGLKTSNRAHNSNFTLPKQPGNPKRIDMDSSFCSFAEKKPFGWTDDDFTCEGTKHALFQQPFDIINRSDSVHFSGVENDLIIPDLPSWGSEFAGTSSCPSRFAGRTDGDAMVETAMNHVSASSENAKVVVGSDLDEISGECKVVGDPIPTAKGTQSMNEESINKELVSHASDLSHHGFVGEGRIVSDVQGNYNHSDPNHKVMMLESFVLQLLRVQSVMPMASANNDFKKV